MIFHHRMHANTFFESGCVKNKAREWAMGSRAFVVTGAHSGRLSGALADVEYALKSQNIHFTVFEGIGNNPRLNQCRELGNKAAQLKADFIIAIGGGSPIDAAKAIAVIAAQPDISTDALFSNAFERALPIVAIPTTSGTGSEVTPFSVLTREDLETKRSFGNLLTLPAVALLDPGYTRSLSADVSLHTAMDAFTHCLESVLSVRAMPVSDALALEGLRRFRPCMQAIAQGDYEEVRDELMLVSMLGGLAITHSGTTLMHGMGYPLTYYKNYTHGEANCAVMGSYLRYIHRTAPDRLGLAMSALGMDVNALAAYTAELFHTKLSLTIEEIAHYCAQTMHQGSTRNTPGNVTEGDIAEIYRGCCCVI